VIEALLELFLIDKYISTSLNVPIQVKIEKATAESTTTTLVVETPKTFYSFRFV